MIEILPETQGNLVAVLATDKLTDADYKNVWIPALEKAITEFGKCACLLQFGEGFKGWEPKAMWDDASFGMKHRNDFTKIAVVGGGKLLEWSSKVAGLLVSCEMKTFKADQYQAAMSWLRS